MPYLVLALVAVGQLLAHGPGETEPSRWAADSSWSRLPARTRIEPRGVSAGDGKRVSDGEIRKRIIAESIANYEGPCACPYQRARNNSLCGRRSAYSRAGGEAPLCYDRDVTDEMVAAYRVEHGLE
jgi:hypothetical protein